MTWNMWLVLHGQGTELRAAEAAAGKQRPCLARGWPSVTWALLEGTHALMQKAPCRGHSYHRARHLLPGESSGLTRGPAPNSFNHNTTVWSRDKFPDGTEQIG